MQNGIEPFVEAGWFKSGRDYVLIGELPVVVCLSLGWGYVAEGFEQPVVVEPGNPFKGCQLN